MSPELAKVRIVEDVSADALQYAALVLEITPPPDLVGDDVFFMYAVFNRTRRFATVHDANVAAALEIARRSAAANLLNTTTS